MLRTATSLQIVPTLRGPHSRCQEISQGFLPRSRAPAYRTRRSAALRIQRLRRRNPISFFLLPRVTVCVVIAVGSRDRLKLTRVPRIYRPDLHAAILRHASLYQAKRRYITRK
ncbi:hypothetical protein PUN28_018133 [Cardiocondyla obscurior]|uniref:Uncharacterized protein n=1 Tax=Cardiocondyla obscurior TaxID=286306 RepID=A0AAW2EFZ4_9HYME